MLFCGNIRRIFINFAIQTDEFAGKAINVHGPHGTYSGDRGQPPDYVFVVFRKSRPELEASPLQRGRYRPNVPLVAPNGTTKGT